MDTTKLQWAGARPTLSPPPLRPIMTRDGPTSTKPQRRWAAPEGAAGTH